MSDLQPPHPPNVPQMTIDSRSFQPGSLITSENEHDEVNHPKHYTQHPSGVECITITEHFNFNLGNAIKYIWRAGEKDSTGGGTLTDLRKAQWYLNRELERLAQELEAH